MINIQAVSKRSLILSALPILLTDGQSELIEKNPKKVILI